MRAVSGIRKIEDVWVRTQTYHSKLSLSYLPIPATRSRPDNWRVPLMSAGRARAPALRLRRETMKRKKCILQAVARDLIVNLARLVFGQRDGYVDRSIGDLEAWPASKV